jgi:hypothetical protein
MRTSKRRPSRGDGMREEYDFSRGIRGKYAAQFPRSSNMVVLAPDVAEFFKTAKAVNDALRTKMSEKRPRRGRVSRRPGRK